MLYCTKFYADKDKIYHSQVNNSYEQLLRALKKSGDAAHWLETCGPTALAIAIHAKYKIKKTTTQNGYTIPDDELITFVLNYGKNSSKYQELRQLDEKYPEHRVPQFFPLALKLLYNIDAIFRYGFAKNVCAEIKQGNSVVFCFKNPGHYCAAVGYDSKTNKILYHNPWPRDPRNKHGGFMEWIEFGEYNGNCHSWYVAIE